VRYLVHYFDALEHLRRSEAIECAADHDAVAAAASRPHPHVVEVWHGDRRVWRDDRRSAFALAS
jgi:hypothetical protein